MHCLSDELLSTPTELPGIPPYRCSQRAVYILGAEDTGLPESVVRACHRHVALPSVHYESFNVAVAGSIVMYDRLAKQNRNS